MKNTKNIFIGVIVVAVIGLALMLLWPESEVTGAVVSDNTKAIETPNECTDLSSDMFYRACMQWKANDYEDKPPKLDMFSVQTAKTICKELETTVC